MRRSSPVRTLWSALLALTLVLAMTPLPAAGSVGHVPEPDDTQAGATPIVVDNPSTTGGFLDAGQGEDDDWFSFEATAGVTYIVRGYDDGAPPYFGIYRPSAAEATVWGSYHRPVLWAAARTGTMYIKVDSHSPGGYDLQVSTAEATGTITGTVTNEQSGAPLDGVDIDIYRPQKDRWTFFGASETSASGGFKIGGLLPGEDFALRFTDHDGNNVAEFYDDVEDVWLWDFPDATPITAPASGLDVRLSTGAQISGIVKDQAHNPIEGAEVCALVWTEYDGPWSPLQQDGPDSVAALDSGDGGMWTEVGPEVTTDENGAYTLSGLPDGRYVVGAWDWDGGHIGTYHTSSHDPDDASQFDLTSGDHVTGKYIVMLEHSTISGTVKNSSGAVLPDTQVELWEWFDSDSRLPRATEEPDTVAEEVPFPGEGSWREVETTSTAIDGSYEFTELEPGQYSLRYANIGHPGLRAEGAPIYMPEWWQDQPDNYGNPTFANRLTLGPNQDFTADAVLEGPGSIEGTITVMGEAPDGHWAAFLYAWSETSESWIGVDASYSTTQGGYYVPELKPDDYKVRFVADDAAQEFWNDSATIAGGSFVTVAERSVTSGVDADLKGGARISGTVVDPAGNPVPFVEVVAKALDEPFGGSFVTDKTWNTVSGAETGPDGTYTIWDLNPDVDYQVTFAEPVRLKASPPVKLPGGGLIAGIGLEWAPETYDDHPTFDMAAPLWDLQSFDVTSAITGVDATVTAPGSIWGDVYDEFGEPISGLETTLYYDVPGHGWKKMSVAEELPYATFEFGWLKAGDWKFVVSDPKGRFAEFVSERITFDGDRDERYFEIVLENAGPVAGDDRYGTSVEASQRAFESGEASAVVLATGALWPDALGGAALAGAMNGPVLLTRSGELPAEVAAEVARLGVDTVVIVGGETAIRGAVEDAVATIPGVTTVERIRGTNRFNTAAAVAQRVAGALGGAWHGQVMVATGESFPDAMAAAPIAASQAMPILLTRADSLPAETADAIGTLPATDVLLLGGETAVGKHVGKALAGLATVERIGGSDRYDTAAMLADYGVTQFGLSYDNLAMATGVHYPDALTGGVIQGREGGVLMLTAPDYLPATTAAALSAHSNDIFAVTYFGGDDTVSATVRAQIEALIQ